VYSKKNFETDL